MGSSCRGLTSGSTTLRYRCQVECPSTGITTTSPMNSGREPINKSPATINPHIAIVTGFLSTTLMDVRIATPAPTSRSRSTGNDTTLIINTTTQNRKPTPFPTTTIVQPSRDG